MAVGRENQIDRALASLPCGVFVLTSQFEGKRAGVLVRSVAVCADEPPMVCAAVRKGHWIEPLIRDSHHFAVCRADGSDKLLMKKFASTSRPRDGDPFDCIGASRLVTGSPILTRSCLVLDCEVVRHFDMEADHELYVGLVVAAAVQEAIKPVGRA